MEKVRDFFNSVYFRAFTTSDGDTTAFTWPQIAREAQDSSIWILNSPMQFAPYQVGDRIAQMVILPYPNVKIREYKELSSTERGDNAFGSTGN